MKKTILKTALVVMSLVTFKNAKSQEIEEKPKITYENLYEQIKALGIKFPDVVFAQAVLETGHFSSVLFKKANNLFGMKKPTKRETLANKDTTMKGYAVFPDWTISVNDYLLWQEHALRKGDVKTKRQYLALLDRIYAEDGKYIYRLNNIMLRHKNILD